LSTQKAETWTRYEHGGAEWENARNDVLADPDLSAFMIDNWIVRLVRSYERVGVSTGKQLGPFERAQAELVFFQSRSVPVLAQMLSVKDGIVAFLAADTLKRIGAPAVDAVARSLADPSPEVRRRAAHLLGELPSAGDVDAAVLEKLGDRLAHDDAWIVRAEAAESLGTRGAQRAERGYAVAVLAHALSDTDATVAQSAASALENVGDPRAIPVLIRALEDAVRRGEPKSAHAIDAALRKLSGESRVRSAEEWSAWWQQHSASKSGAR
jgi:HEAT repeat protein